MLHSLVAQKPAESGGGVCEFPGRTGWRRSPAQEALKKDLETGWRNELSARCLNVPSKCKNIADELPFLPEAEGIAIGEENVRQRAQLLALLLIVGNGELTRIGALAGRLDFDKAGQSVIDSDCVIGAETKVAERRLADTDHILVSG